MAGQYLSKVLGLRYSRLTKVITKPHPWIYHTMMLLCKDISMCSTPKEIGTEPLHTGTRHEEDLDCNLVFTIYSCQTSYM